MLRRFSSNALISAILLLSVFSYLSFALPVINYVSPTPANNSFNSSTSVYVNITSSESASQARLEWGNASGFTNVTMSNNSLTNWYKNMLGLSERTYNYTVWVQNTTGDWNVSVRRFVTVDWTPPIITVQQPNTSVYARKWVWTNITLNEAGSWCGVSLNGTANQALTNSSGNWNRNLTVPSEGSNSIVVYCNDTAGNLGSSSTISFTIDTSNRISFATGTEANNSYKSQDWIYANISLNEGNFKNLTFYLYNTTALVNSTNYTNTVRDIKWFSLPEGVYYFNATYYDTAGTKNSTETRRQTLDRTAPSASLSLSAASVYLGQSLTISCSGSDGVLFSSGSAAVEKPSGSVVAATCGQEFAGTTEIGTYTVTYTATDAAGNSASDSKTFAVHFSGGSSSDTGSGGSSSSTTTKTIVIASDVSLTKVTLNLNTAASAASVDVVKLPGAPASVSSPTGSSVYHYINITRKNFDNSQVKNATLEFRVEKSWMNANNITSVYLARYDNGWSKLRTDLVSSTSTHNNYRAYTPGFSYFAVVGEKQAAPQEEKATEPPKETQKPQQETPATAPKQPEGKPDFWGYVKTAAKIAAIIFAAIFLWFANEVRKELKRKKKHS